ncbi:MAG: hypothetical protein Q7U21_10810 [Lutibacter sp.]|nr:hypothetical protein [Lutibacter sp.]
MKKHLLFILLIGFPLIALSQNQNSDSIVKVLIKDLQNLKTDNENLQKRIESQDIVLSDLTKIQRLSDHTKWEIIKSNIKTGRKSYDFLSKKITALKSELISQDYQNYIKSLGSVKNSPLGFSFDEVILKTAQDNVIFKQKNFVDRFEKTVKSISNSLLAGLIPYASEAITISNSVLNIAYSAGFQNVKVDLDKIKSFEKELNRYISYYIELDKANVLNNSFNYQTVVLLESIQYDLLTEIKKSGIKLNFTPREMKSNETIDNYLIAILNDFSDEYVDNYLKEVKSKHKNDVDVLQLESNVKNVNNNLDNLIQLSNRFKNIYDSYFELSSNYYTQLRNTLELANKNKIIEPIKEKNEVQVYDELMSSLTVKRQKSESTLKSNVNIDELLKSNNKIELIKFI